MNSEWIEINLPWYVPNHEPIKYLEYPTFDHEVRIRFGQTVEEKKIETYGSEEPSFDHPYLQAIEELKDEFNALYTGSLDYDQKKAAQNEYLSRSIDPRVHSVLDYWAHKKKVDDWYEEQLEIIEVAAKNKQIFEAWQKESAVKSFTGRGLAVAGILIEIDQEGALSQLLIGNLNELGGTCDDCMAFGSETIVKRYKKVWEPNNT